MDKIIDAYKKFLQNYANFSGRASRADYWYAVLANMIIGFVIGFVCGFIAGIIPALASITLIITSLYSLAILIPGISIVVRRLHDVNKSGWYYFIALIPLVGFILLLIALCSPSVNESNKYSE